MFITRECDYAVRVIRALGGEGRLSVNEICDKEDITAPFAYKILKKLQKAEIVKGYRGVHGGYVLNKMPNELTLYDVYHAIDSNLTIIDCLDPDFGCSRDGADGVPCMVHRELCEIQAELLQMLQRRNLQEILEREEN